MPTRRPVLAGTAAALAGLPAPAHATPAESRPYRRRTAVIGGTGFATGTLFHPTAPGLAHARTDIGGAHRWDQRTARWTPLTDRLGRDDSNLLGGEAVAVDPAHPDRLYLARGTYTQPRAGRGALLRSENRARTWIRINDDAHQRGWTGPAVTGDPRVHGRVCLAANGRGIRYGEPV
ncbi:hypothetical protein ACFY98_31540 [Streptomyces tricolor]|uniref:hypothetical protein n=1 Tax=Streptomyces tricolor TaxID=68277 RepID=UPI0036E0E9B9